MNILRDPKAAEFVAAIRNGDEEVPTVVTGGGQLIDATPAEIMARLSGDA